MTIVIPKNPSDELRGAIEELIIQAKIVAGKVVCQGSHPCRSTRLKNDLRAAIKSVEVQLVVDAEDESFGGAR